MVHFKLMALLTPLVQSFSRVLSMRRVHSILVLLSWHVTHFIYFDTFPFSDSFYGRGTLAVFDSFILCGTLPDLDSIYDDVTFVINVSFMLNGTLHSSDSLDLTLI